MSNSALAPVQPNGSTVAMSAPLTASDVRAQVQLIQEVMSQVMKVDEHYGTIPGTQKPTLLKAGAEKLCLTFRLDPEYDITERYDGDHLTVNVKCILFHIPTSNRMGSGLGSCSTKESKYAYRKANRKCPKCQKETIFKSKNEGEGWYCWRKKDGCGATFAMGDAAIESQQEGRVINEDKADQYNTVLKMACKRALIAAVLNVTAASDIFTQDLEDMPIVVPDDEKKPEKAPAKEQPKAPPGWVGLILSTNRPGKGAWVLKALGDDGKEIDFATTVPEHVALANTAVTNKTKVRITYVTNSSKLNVVKSFDPILPADSAEAVTT